MKLARALSLIVLAVLSGLIIGGGLATYLALCGLL